MFADAFGGVIRSTVATQSHTTPAKAGAQLERSQ